jgi:hypothetical protein
VAPTASIADFLSAPASGNDFCIAYLPDTQLYSQDYPATFEAQTQWIADNAVGQGIKIVLHVGDVVENPIQEQFDNALVAMDILQTAGIPNLVAMGNHDYVGSSGDDSVFNANFPQSRYTAQGWWDGGFYHATKSQNHYLLLTIGEKDYLFITLQYDISTEVLAWAEGLIQTYSGCQVIITAHSVLFATGIRTTQGEDILYEMARKYGNVLLIGCGHHYGEYNRVDQGDCQNWVNCFLVDYQTRANGGDGWLRLAYFKPNSRMVLMKTYSVTLESFEEDSDSYFVMCY